MQGYVKSLHIHPLKSGGILDTEMLHIGPLGPMNDRRWMLIQPPRRDPDSWKLFSQRDRRGERLALVQTEVSPDGREVTFVFPDGDRHSASSYSPNGVASTAEIHDRPVDVRELDPELSAVFQEYLEHSGLQLVQRNGERTTPPIEGEPSSPVDLADGFPLLLTNEASRADLECRHGGPDVEMSQFRPNIVVGGLPAYDEDTWGDVLIGDLRLRCVKPCARCSITSVDQELGFRKVGKGPLATLLTYRAVERPSTRRPGKMSKDGMFGINAVHLGTGVIRVGDPVVIESRREAPAFLPPKS